MASFEEPGCEIVDSAVLNVFKDHRCNWKFDVYYEEDKDDTRIAPVARRYAEFTYQGSAGNSGPNGGS